MGKRSNGRKEGGREEGREEGDVWIWFCVFFRLVFILFRRNLFIEMVRLKYWVMRIFAENESRVMKVEYYFESV